MIQIICDEDGNPEKAGYSWHYEAKIRDWDDVDLFLSSYPKVYVAKGGHGSFYDENKNSITDPRGNYGKDYTFRNQDDYRIIILTNEGWLNFKGNWGKDSGSVPGPAFRHTKPDVGNAWLTPTSYMWIEPLYWQSVI